MANNYSTGYPPYQYPAQSYPKQESTGYQQYSDAEPVEYRRQPPYAPIATAPVIQPMPAPIVQQQPLYAPAPQHYQQAPYPQQAAPSSQGRPNVVIIQSPRSPGCLCMCLKAICDVIWTIIVFIVIVILVIAGISILHRYVN